MRSQRRRLRSRDVAPGPDRLSRRRVNRRRVAPYVDRLLAAEALVFSFPVWNMGFPAILKGFVDKVFLPGVSFTPERERRLYALPAQHQAARRRLHLRRPPVSTFLMGDPPRRFVTRSCAASARPARAATMSPITTWTIRAGAARGVPARGRGEVLGLVKGALNSLALDDPAMLDQFGRREIHERPHPRCPAKIGVGQRP